MRLTCIILLTTILVLSSCGDDAPGWEEAYRTRLQAESADLSSAETVQACASVDPMTDDELRQLLASQAGGDTTFDDLMSELGIEPTVADYDQAIEIALENLRSLCS